MVEMIESIMYERLDGDKMKIVERGHVYTEIRCQAQVANRATDLYFSTYEVCLTLFTSGQPPFRHIPISGTRESTSVVRYIMNNR